MLRPERGPYTDYAAIYVNRYSWFTTGVHRRRLGGVQGG